MVNGSLIIVGVLGITVIGLLVKNSSLQQELVQNSLQHDITKKDLQSELNKEVERYEVLRNELTKNDGKLSETLHKLKENEKEFSNAVNALSESNGLVVKLKSEIQEKEDEMAQVKDENEQLQVQVGEMKEQIVAVESHLQKLGSEFATLKNSQEDNLQKLHETELRNEELQKQAEHLALAIKANGDLTKENQQLKSMLEAMQKLGAERNEKKVPEGQQKEVDDANANVAQEARENPNDAEDAEETPDAAKEEERGNGENQGDAPDTAVYDMLEKDEAQEAPREEREISADENNNEEKNLDEGENAVVNEREDVKEFGEAAEETLRRESQAFRAEQSQSSFAVPRSVNNASSQNQ